MRLFVDGAPLAGSGETLKRIGERSGPPQVYSYGNSIGLDIFDEQGRQRFHIRSRVDPVHVYDLVADAARDIRYAKQRDYLGTIDALVFVVDSQSERLDAGRWRLEELRHALARLGRELDRLPIVFQLNKRDIPGVVAEPELRERFRSGRCAYVSTVATQGKGIDALIEAVIRIAQQPSGRAGV